MARETANGGSAMIRMSLVYSYIHHLEGSERQANLYHLLSYFTGAELEEVSQILEGVRQDRAAHTLPKVRLEVKG